MSNWRPLASGERAQSPALPCLPRGRAPRGLRRAPLGTGRTRTRLRPMVTRAQRIPQMALVSARRRIKASQAPRRVPPAMTVAAASAIPAQAGAAVEPLAAPSVFRLPRSTAAMTTTTRGRRTTRTTRWRRRQQPHPPQRAPRGKKSDEARATGPRVGAQMMAAPRRLLGAPAGGAAAVMPPLPAAS